jgi:CHAT domain-containing protein
VLTYAPNAQALGVARRHGDEIRGEHLVAVDEPDLGIAGSRFGLPFSSLEVEAAAAAFNDHEIVSGPDADTQNVLAALERAQYFHLSCHGQADPAAPLNSALAMAGGQPLTLRDILGRRLRARVGVLSACETAIPGDELPDEVVSLPTGLIQAGTGTAVASLWSVPGGATALLMFRFYERWRVRGANPAEALNDAQRWLRDSSGSEKISYFEGIALDDHHPMAGAAQEPYELLYRIADPARRDYESPYHWAAFSCVGA